MSELSDKVAREHRYLPDGCTCGERRPSQESTRGSFLPHAQHIAEVTEAAVRETIKFDPNDGDANAAILTPMLVELARTLEPIKDYAKGYRTALVREGWNETAAEAMAVQVHNSLIESAFRAPA